MAIQITKLEVQDIRFPTSDQLDGSDAIHVDPDYSCAYVTLQTNQPGLEGHGITFTLGRGTELCVAVIRAFESFVVGQTLESITEDFAGFWHRTCNESQLRWLGPERGLVHMSVAGIFNANALFALIVGMPQLVAGLLFVVTVPPSAEGCAGDLLDPPAPCTLAEDFRKPNVARCEETRLGHGAAHAHRILIAHRPRLLPPQEHRALVARLRRRRRRPHGPQLALRLPRAGLRARRR